MSGAAYYEVWRDYFEYIGDAYGTDFYNYSGLQAGETVTYEIDAYDADDNYLDTSNELRVTVPCTVCTPCPSSLSTTSASFTYSGGNNNFSVTAEGCCSWSANPSVGWITTSSGGSGSGTVLYSVAVNPGTGSRNGSITVGSKTFSISQSGAPNYTITVSPSPSGGGTVGGGGTFPSGSYRTVTATANSGYTFDNWTEGGSILSFSSSYSFTLTGSRTLVANFKPDYTITVSPSPSGGGTVSGGGTFPSGSYRTVTATANSGYTFDSWTESGSIVSFSSSYSFTLTGSRTLVANFKPNYTITVSAAPSPGGTVSGGGTFASGNFQTVSAAPGSDYSFVNWTENGIPVSSLANYTFTLTGNRNLVANFILIYYSIGVTAFPSAGGTVSGGGTFGSGSYHTVTATANSGYTFGGWTEGGSLVSSSPSYGFTLSRNRSLQANFPCSFSLPQAGAFHPPGQSTSNVVINTGLTCQWAATSNVPWLTFTSPNSGSSSGSISYSVDANPDCVQRSGTITVAGQDFIITQAAGSGSYSLTQSGATHPSVADTGSVQVNTGAGCPWLATKDAAWISFTSATGGSGTGSISYSVAANPDCVQRSGTITVAGLSFTVTQAAGSGAYVLAQSSASHPAGSSSGSVQLSVGVSCPWTASADVGWISFTSPSTGIGSDTVSYSVAANPDCVQRIGRIMIGGQVFTATQAAGSGSYSLTKSSATHPSGGDTGSVQVNTGIGCTWSATKDAAWISFTSATTGSGTSNISYSVAANSDCVQRSGTITVAGLPFTVTQAAGSGTYTLVESGASHPAGSSSGTAQLNVGVGCPWTASADVSWISFTSATSGSGAGSAAYSVAANPDCVTRTGTITMGGQPFAVTQAAGSGSYALTPGNAAPPAAGGTSQVAVATGVACPWTSSSQSAWISVLSGSTGSGPGQVIYSVTANAAAALRTGSMTVAGELFPVTQVGNDHFENRIPLLGATVTVSGSSPGATAQNDEPGHAGTPARQSLWWSWVAPLNGTVTVSTYGSSFDTRLVLYTGTSIGGLTQVTENDDDGQLTTSRVCFGATAGTEYQIAVDGYDGAAGEIVLALAESAPGVVSIATDSALPGATVGVRYARTFIAAGDCGGFGWAQVGGTLPPGLSLNGAGVLSGIPAVAGSYGFTVRATGAGGGSADKAFTMNVNAGVNTPANDLFANAGVLSGMSATDTSWNIGASAETGEPTHAGSAAMRSVWWAWTAPQSGHLTIGTHGSSFDTRLAVYNETALASLKAVAANDDYYPDYTSRVRFDVVSGTRYLIAVDGYEGDSGTIRLSVVAGTGPGNDALADAYGLQGRGVSAAGNNVGATQESGEAAHTSADGGPSVWWNWTAPDTGLVTISTAGSTFDTMLWVFAGDTVASLQHVAADDDSGPELTSEATFAATAGTTYRVVVDGYLGDEGQISLQLTQTAFGSGPTIASSGVLPSGVVQADYDYLLEGSSVGALAWTTVAGSGQLPPGLSLSMGGRIAGVPTAAGSYLFLVRATDPAARVAEQAFRIDVAAAPAGPANDAFTNTTVLTGLTATASGSNANATKEENEPNHAGDPGGRSVWWVWQAPQTGLFRVTTAGSTFDTLLVVYRGDALASVQEVTANDDAANAVFTSEVVFYAQAGVSYHVAVDGVGGETGAIQLSLSATAGLTVHRLGAEALAFSATDDIDAPLEIRPDAAILGSQPVLGQGTDKEVGLVADGVTPLLIKLTLPFAPAEPTVYQVDLQVANGSLGGASVSSRFMVLSGGTFQSASTWTVSGREAFAVVTPIRSEELVLAPGANPPELGVTVSLSSSSGGVDGQFKVRKPPVALLHGYQAASDTWSPEFQAVLWGSRAPEFVRTIDYGVRYSGGIPDPFVNTHERLDFLSCMLSSQLQTDLEDSTSALHNSWAFTRYDVIGHSQGGVLARVLCSQDARAAYPGMPCDVAFRNSANQYRGRFHRVITLGSPHNGSLLAYYLMRLAEQPGLYGALPRWLLDRGTLQEKFSPFGCQIREINSELGPVDPDAKFRLLRTTVADGNPPGFGSCPPGYFLFGLCAPAPGHSGTRGQIVLPYGSDGVVDFASQGGGVGTPVDTVTGQNIPHFSGAGALLAYGHILGQTARSDIANLAAQLLDGPDSAFGSFVRPTLLADSLKSTIDSIIPESVVADIIRSLGSVGGGVFEFLLEPAIQPADQITWSAEAYGPGGVTWDGVTVQVDPNNNRHVYVSVDPSVAGDIVVFASYVGANGTLVTARPVVVVSRPPGEAERGIELAPSSATLVPGDAVPVTIWLVYTNGARSLAFVGGNVSPLFASSAPSVVSVDTSGHAAAIDYGTATVSASYRGFTAQASYSVLPPSGRPLLINPSKRADGTFEFTLVGASGRTFEVQATTNLLAWSTFTNVTSTSVLVPLVDLSATNGQPRFYRAVTR